MKLEADQKKPGSTMFMFGWQNVNQWVCFVYLKGMFC